MKKIISSVVVSSVFLSGMASVYAQAPDLSALGGNTTTTTTTDTSASGSTATATGTTATDTNKATTGVEVATVKIIPSLPNVEAGSTTPVEVIVVAETKTGTKLTDKDIDLTAEVIGNDANKSKGEFKVGTYSEGDQYFKFSYVPGKEAGTMQLSVKATSKTNPQNTITETATIVVSDAKNSTTAPTTTTSTPEITPISTNTNTTTNTDIMVEPKANDSKESAANTDKIKITKTEVLDLNRIKVSFDHKIALSDNPLEMVTVETVKDKKNLPVSNITLGADEKSIVILTKEPLAKEEYHVTIKTVVDGETMKAVTLANGVTTVSGTSELLLLLTTLLASIGVFAYRRKSAK